MQWFTSLVSEYDGKALQRTGMLTKDQLTMFFQRSKEQFMNPEFKLLLRAAHKHGRSTEESINGMQQQVFQAMGVQGDFGISCLARVTQVHNDDAFFIRSFFEFVQLEEQTLDEADMEEEAYRAKYRHLNQVKARMEAQMQKMEGMSAEEQQRFMAEVFKNMIAQDTDYRAPPGATPAAGPSNVAMPAPSDVASTSNGGFEAQPKAALSEDEQLAFFASLSGGSKPQ